MFMTGVLCTVWGARVYILIYIEGTYLVNIYE